MKVSYRCGQIVVSHLSDDNVHRIPFSDVDGISIFGMAQLSTHLVRECIASNVPIYYYSEDGHYFGSTSSHEQINPARQKRQIYLTDNNHFCLEWSRAVIDAKIHNGLALLSSLSSTREFSEIDLRGLHHSQNNLSRAESVEMAIGFEGNAAKCYFKCLSKAVQNDQFNFRKRSARPPKDPFNSMLSFGYSVFYRNIIGAIERHGLHP